MNIVYSIQSQFFSLNSRRRSNRNNAYCAPAGQISTNEPIELKLGSPLGKTSNYPTNVFMLQFDALGLSYELPKLAFIFPIH